MVSADTIVSFPTSVNGFKHVMHAMDVHTNFRVAANVKDKGSSDIMLYWIKHLTALTGKPLVYLLLDQGELSTNTVKSWVQNQGGQVTEALAGVHSNESAERRHRTLKEIMNALMARGGAGPKLWEFTTANANAIINYFQTSLN